MNKIDISRWGEFELGDLFALVNSKAYHSNDIEDACNEDEKINYITRSKFNNGLNRIVKKTQGLQINPAGTISFGAENANFFYQENEYITGNKMYYIDTQNISAYACRFLQVVLEARFTKNFSFSDGMIPGRIKNEKILLPITDLGNPDWTYMEEYMKELEKKVSYKINKLTLSEYFQNECNTDKWKRFHLYDIFNIDAGTKLDRIAMKFDNPTINFVGRSGVNNGVTTCVDEIEGCKPFKAGNLTLALGGAYLGSCFVQDKYFYTSQNVVVLIPKFEMSFNTKQFICSMIFKEGQTYYKAFIDELNRHIKTDFSIKLPVDKSGNIDYEYIDNFMDSINKNTISRFEIFADI